MDVTCIWRKSHPNVIADKKCPPPKRSKVPGSAVVSGGWKGAVLSPSTCVEGVGGGYNNSRACVFTGICTKILK